MNISDNTRKRSWFLVINEKCFNDNVNYENMYNLVDSLKPVYAIWNKEKGDTGNIHIHLYLEFDNAKSKKRLKKIFGNAHFEPRLGNPTEARNYIIKPEGMEFGGEEKSHTLIAPYVEYGDFKSFENTIARPGSKKSDNDKIFEYVEKYNSIDEVRKIDPSLVTRHRSNLEKLFYNKKYESFLKSSCNVDISDNGEQLITVNRKVSYLYGPSRCGKTYGVQKKYGFSNVSIITSYSSPMRYDKYKVTPVMVLDEFYGQMDFTEFLTLADCYITELSCRYEDKPNLTNNIVCTSNLSFSSVYDWLFDSSPSKYKAFLMRFTGGIWEIYKLRDGTRIICDRTSKYIKDDYILSMQREAPISLTDVVLLPPSLFDKMKSEDLKD